MGPVVADGRLNTELFWSVNETARQPTDAIDLTELVNKELRVEYRV